eukprot:jgi/Picre1/32443/NNA_007789.t1
MDHPCSSGRVLGQGGVAQREHLQWECTQSTMLLELFREEKCAFVRNMVFANTAMQTRQALEAQQSNWINEHGTVPPGNGIEKDVWDVPFNVTAMSDKERNVYHAKREKMVAAMGEVSHQILLILH